MISRSSTNLRKDVYCLRDAFAFPAHIAGYKYTPVTTIDVDSPAWLFPYTFAITLVGSLVSSRDRQRGRSG